MKEGWHIKSIDGEDVTHLPFVDVVKRLGEKSTHLSDASDFDALVHAPQAATAEPKLATIDTL